MASSTYASLEMDQPEESTGCAQRIQNGAYIWYATKWPRKLFHLETS